MHTELNTGTSTALVATSSSSTLRNRHRTSDSYRTFTTMQPRPMSVNHSMQLSSPSRLKQIALSMASVFTRCCGTSETELVPIEKKPHEVARTILEQQIKQIDQWRRQILEFIDKDARLQKCFSDTYSQTGCQVALTTVPLLPIDQNNPQDVLYALDRNLDNCKRQFRELIRFIASNEGLWLLFISLVQQTETNTMKILLDTIFQLLKKHIDEDAFKSIKIVLSNEVKELKTNNPYQERFIRTVLVKLTSAVLAFQFFSDEMIKSVEK
jgi:hypothetical protein